MLWIPIQMGGINAAVDKGGTLIRGNHDSLKPGSRGIHLANLVCLKRAKDEHWQVEVTDGRTLVMVNGASIPTLREEQTCPKVEVPEVIPTRAVILAEHWVRAFELATAARAERVGIILGDPSHFVWAGDSPGKMEFILSADHFPNADAVIPTRNLTPESYARLDVRRLLKLAKFLHAFTTKGDIPVVDIISYGRDKPLGFALRSANYALTVDGFIMQLS